MFGANRKPQDERAHLNMASTNALNASIELISFEISDQTFCIDIASVREIRGWTPITSLPRAPAFVLGVINLRGAVMPVLDLRARLDLGATQPTSRHVIMVVEHLAATVGLLVDAVQETFVIDRSLLQAAPNLQPGAERLVEDVFTLDGHILSRLSVAALVPQELAAA